MTDSPLTAEREQEIRNSIPTVYGPPWTVHPDMNDDVWRVKYATDHPLAGLVCEVPDYGAHLAEFIATARAAVPELLAEIERLRAELATHTRGVLRQVADMADPDAPEVSFFGGMVGPSVAAWLRMIGDHPETVARLAAVVPAAVETGE